MYKNWHRRTRIQNFDSLVKSKDKIGKLICEFHGTDIDIKKNKNLEFRDSYIKYKNTITKLMRNGWLIPWDWLFQL